MKQLLLLMGALFLSSCAQTPSLQGTSWQLVKFQGGDGTVLQPDDRSKYTLAFDADGTLNARIDCNRGRGGWKSAGKGRIEFTPMAVTRAMCPPGSIDSEVLKRLPYIRSFVVKDGRLFLSMMADGGAFEFEPSK